MKAVILVGGQATRLRPLTLNTPKALIELQGQTILEHVLDLLKKYQVTEIILAVGYLKEQIMDYFGNGSKFGVKISYIEEDEPLGTAGPLLKIKNQLTETFIAGNGDELKDLDIAQMLNFHQRNKAAATLALTRVEDPSMYGVAKMEGDKILEFIEKPPKDKAPSNLINAGFYILEPEILELIKAGKSMLEYDVFPELATEGKLFGYEFSGQWFDTGNFERLEKARSQWKKNK